MRTAMLVLLFVAGPAHGQWSPIGDMPRPSLERNSLRFENAQAVAVITALSPEVIRVRVTPAGREVRDYSYAIVDRELESPGATFALDAEQSTLFTDALRVTIHHAPFRVAFSSSGGESLDEDDSRGTVLSPAGAIRVSKRLRNDEQIYGLGEKNGPLNKRGWKLGGYSFTMWNSDTFGYDASTDPLYVSVPFYLVLRSGKAHGIFLDNTFRSNFDIGHQTEGVLSFGAEGGALDYYFIHGPDPKSVLQRYTQLTGRMPLPPLWSLGYHQCRYSYYPESRVRFIADNFRERRIPGDVIWLDIHYQDRYRPFTWNAKRFPDPARLIGDLRKQGFRTVTIVDPHPPKVSEYAPYESGLAGDHFVKNPDGSIYEAPVWPAKAEDGDTPDWSNPNGLMSVFPDFSKPATRAWWGGLHADLLDAGVAGIWNDMNEPAVFDTPTGTMPLDVRHDNEGAPSDHREVHNVYGMLMTRSTHEGLLRLRPNERPFVLSRASFAGGQRYAALWPGDNVSDWTALRSSIPMLLGMGLSGYPFVGVDIGGFAEAPTPELFTRWLQAGVFYPFMRTHSAFGTPDQEPWSYGADHEEINRRAIELRYRLLPYIYNVMRESAESGLPAMRPLMLEYPEDGATYGMDDQFLFGSDLLVAPVLRAGVTSRGVYLPRGDWYDYWTGQRHSGGKSISVPVTLASLPLFVRAGAFLFQQPVVQHTGEMAGQPLDVTLYPGGNSERFLYEDAGNGFDYQSGAFARRRFAVREEALGFVVEIDAPDGSYRPQSRALRVSVPRAAATRVSIAGEPLTRMNAEQFEKSERGWTVRDGAVQIKMPDTFEKVEIQIE
ncbi:MAG TPA: glycoside hydrolase family 31 protein [Thermoanaerobaculia bacterium]|jgi:alpha-glucosidase|nr:glycoside hydrolase family 31 protein [Thermoanaerobaculia bacterium]